MSQGRRLGQKERTEESLQARSCAKIKHFTSSSGVKSPKLVASDFYADLCPAADFG